MGKSSKRKAVTRADDGARAGSVKTVADDKSSFRLSVTQTITGVVGCIIAVMSFVLWHRSSDAAVDIQVRQLIEEAHDQLSGREGVDPLDTHLPLEGGDALARTELAWRKISQALILDPNSFDAHNVLGIYYALRGNYEMARREFNVAIKCDPTQPVPHDSLGHLFVRLGRYDLAIMEFQTSISLSPSRSAAHSNLASALLDQFQSAPSQQPELLLRAERHIRDALLRDAQDAESHRILGNILDYLGKSEDAAREYIQALRWAVHREQSAYIHYDYGVSLNRSARYAEAREHLKRAIELVPKYPKAYAQLGVALRGTGNDEEAIGAALAAVRLAPGERTASLLILTYERDQRALVEEVREREAASPGGYLAQIAPSPTGHPAGSSGR